MVNSWMHLISSNLNPNESTSEASANEVR